MFSATENIYEFCITTSQVSRALCKVNISVRRTGTGTKIKLKIQINLKKVISRSFDYSGLKSMLKLIYADTAEYYRLSHPSDWQYSLWDGINYFLLRCFYQSIAVKLTYLFLRQIHRKHHVTGYILVCNKRIHISYSLMLPSKKSCMPKREYINDIESDKCRLHI